MKLLRSFCMALSMYSRLPVPRVSWEEENMAYVMCFFPLVGAFIGCFWLVWLWLAGLLGFGKILCAAVATLIPLTVSGGIHMDGFLDTADALGSHASRERMLEIMKDSHTGASALIAAAVYILLFFGFWTEVDASITALALYVLALVPVLSRALSALAVVTFRNARGHGLLASFKKAADVKTVRAVSVLWIICLAAAMICLNSLCGGAVLAAALASFIVYRILSYKRFGGTTGDVAGWFVQVCELACLGAFVLAAKIGGGL